MDKASSNRKTVVSTCCAVVGGLGAAACAVSMTLAALGVLGTAVASAGAASMQGMGNRPGGSAQRPSDVNPLINFLFQAGPAILLVSIALLALSFVMRRRTAAFLVVLVEVPV